MVISRLPTVSSVAALPHVFVAPRIEVQTRTFLFLRGQLNFQRNFRDLGRQSGSRSSTTAFSHDDALELQEKPCGRGVVPSLPSQRSHCGGLTETLFRGLIH